MKFTAEHCRKISEAQIGRKHSLVTLHKMSLAHRGNKSTTGKFGPSSNRWKGDMVGYRGLHYWVQNMLGKPRHCENCLDDNLRHRQYHWANISGHYQRIASDWRRLCVKCHVAFDRNRAKPATL